MRFDRPGSIVHSSCNSSKFHRRQVGHGWISSTFSLEFANYQPRMGRMEYRVELDVYNGPLDLLLYLIKKDELDIYDIPIASITDSYMSYLKVLRELRAEHGVDINVAGDFLVMAATLMEIKSAMLLPRQPSEQTQEGDRKSTR